MTRTVRSTIMVVLLKLAKMRSCRLKISSRLIWDFLMVLSRFSHFGIFCRSLIKISLLWTRRFNSRHYKLSIAGEISYDIYNYNQSLAIFIFLCLILNIISLSNIESILTTNTRSDKRFQSYIKLLLKLFAFE